jgi:hypothetical protein
MPVPSRSIIRSLTGAAALTLSLGFAAAPAAASASASESARMAEDFIVFLRDGSVREVTVLDFDERTLRYEDLGPEATMPIADVLAMVQGRDGELARVARQPILRRTRGMVELRTGERIPGLLGATPPSDPERFSWIQTPLGDLELALEDVAEIIFLMENDPGPIELDDGDRVVLANGDRLDGFLDSVGIRIGVIRGEGAEEELIEVPVDRVAGIRLVADAARPGERRVWLADGTVVDVDRVRVDGADGGVFVDGRKLGAELLPLNLDDVAAVLFDTRRLRPLSSIELERIEPLGSRYHVEPPTDQQPLAAAGLGVIELRGPMAATWIMPDGAGRFAATAVLPAVARTWGDLELVVLDGREERFRVRIDGTNPVAEIDVPLSAVERRLTLRLEAGRYGPIMDRIELRLARVLVD